MYLKKELYREFERKLFIYESEAFKPVDIAGQTEGRERKEDEETKEVEEASQRAMPEEIAKHKKTVTDKIEEIEKSLPPEQREGAKVFLDKIRGKVEEDFNEIMKEYLELIKKGTDTYKGSRFEKGIERKAEDLAERIINRDLKDRQAVKELTKEFLKEVPNVEVQEGETKFLTDLIQADPELKERYGEEGESRHLKRVIKLLAKKYDLRFDNEGNLLYGIDLTDNKVYGAEGKNTLKDRIQAELKTDDYKPKNLRKERRELRKETKELRKDRIEVKRNKLFHPEGGRVNTWEELKTGPDEHEALGDLREVNKKVKDQVEAIEEAKLAAEAELRLMERKGPLFKAHHEILSQADLNTKFTEAESKGYTLIPEKHLVSELSQDNYVDAAALKSPDGNTEITVTVENGIIRLTIENNGPENKFKTERSFSNAADFKNQINLVQESEQQNISIKVNRKTVENFDIATYQEGVKQYIPPKFYNDTELANPNFHLEPSPIMFENQKVGVLTAVSSDNFTLEVADQKLEGVTKENLPKELKKLEGKMKEVVERSEKIKAEIQAQAGAPENGITYEGIEMRQTLEGDFTDPRGYIEIAQLKRTDDQSIAARISIAVDGEAGGRIYKIETEEETKNFNDAKALNAYLDTYGELIIKFPEKAEALKEPDKALKEKAKGNIIKAINYLYPDAKEIAQDDEFTRGYINGILNHLGDKDPALLQKIADSNDLSKLSFSKEEEKTLREGIIKGLGMENLEKSDEAEIKLIGEIEITVQGKKESFKTFFGEGLIKMVSMTQQIESQNGITMIKKGEGWVQPTAENMLDNLPFPSKDYYKEVLSGEKVHDKMMDAVLYGTFGKYLENIAEVKNLIESPEMAKSLEKMSSSERITSVLVAVQLIMQWIKDGDYQSASDAWEAVNSQEGINGRLETSKKVYKEVIEKADFSNLLAVHSNPNGPEAKSLLGDKAKTPFRGQFKDVATERLQTILGPGTKIKDWKGDRLIIGQQEKEFEVFLVPVPGGTDFIKMGEMKAGALTVHQKYEFNGLTGKGQTLETVFAEMRGEYSPLGPLPTTSTETNAEISSDNKLNKAEEERYKAYKIENNLSIDEKEFKGRTKVIEAFEKMDKKEIFNLIINDKTAKLVLSTTGENINKEEIKNVLNGKYNKDIDPISFTALIGVIYGEFILTKEFDNKMRLAGVNEGFELDYILNNLMNNEVFLKDIQKFAQEKTGLPKTPTPSSAEAPKKEEPTKEKPTKESAPKEKPATSVKEKVTKPKEEKTSPSVKSESPTPTPEASAETPSPLLDPEPVNEENIGPYAEGNENTSDTPTTTESETTSSSSAEPETSENQSSSEPETSSSGSEPDLPGNN